MGLVSVTHPFGTHGDLAPLLELFGFLLKFVIILHTCMFLRVIRWHVKAKFFNYVV